MGRLFHRIVRFQKVFWIFIVPLGMLYGAQTGFAETKSGSEEQVAPEEKKSLKPVFRPKPTRVKLNPIVHKASAPTTQTAALAPAPKPEHGQAPVKLTPKVKRAPEPEKEIAAPPPAAPVKIAPPAKKTKEATEEAAAPDEESPSEKGVTSENKPAAHLKPAATPREKAVAREEAKPTRIPTATPKAEETVVASKPEKKKRRHHKAEAQKSIVTAAVTPAAKPEATPAPVAKLAPHALPTSIKAEPKPAETPAPMTKTEVAVATPLPQPPQKAVASNNPSAKPVPVDEATIKADLAAAPTSASREQLRQFAKANPASPLAPVAYLRVGEISQALNDPPGAEEAYQGAVATANDAKSRQQAQARLALAAAQAGHFKAAAQDWAALSRNAPEVAKDPQAINAHALALAADSDYQGAAGLWGQLEKMPASDKPTTGTITPSAKATALFGQALAAELQGQRKEAREQLERIIRNFASTPEAALARKRLTDVDKPLVQ